MVCRTNVRTKSSYFYNTHLIIVIYLSNEAVACVTVPWANSTVK